MKRYYWIGALLILTLLFAAGCVKVDIEETPQPIQTEDYVILEMGQLTDKDAYAWALKAVEEPGSYHYFEDNEAGISYILFSYGTLPTAGYEVRLEEFVKAPGEWTFRVGLEAPPRDAMVAQVLTTPYLLLRVKSASDVALHIVRDPYIPEADLMDLAVRLNGRADSHTIEVEALDEDAIWETRGLPERTFAVQVPSGLASMLEGIADGALLHLDLERDEAGSLVLLALREDQRIEPVVPFKGVYIGRIDPTFVEIMTDGEFVSCWYPMEDLEQADPEDYTAVNGLYTEGTAGQWTLVSLSEAPLPEIAHESEEFIGLGTVERTFHLGTHWIDGDCYWQAGELLMLSSKRILDGDTIRFTYYRDEYGRNVIIDYE